MRDSEHTYIIMWTPEDILDLIDFTLHEQNHLVLLLSDDPNANLVGNPVRAMVIDSVLDTKKYREIWQFESLLTAEEICDEWEKNRQSVMDEIRDVGTLIYDTVGRIVKC
jgi:hypothetical protein